MGSLYANYKSNWQMSQGTRGVENLKRWGWRRKCGVLGGVNYQRCCMDAGHFPNFFVEDFLLAKSTPLAYNELMNPSLYTIVETRPFIQDAKSRLTVDERIALINMIATDPTCGAVIEGTGGVRKVRFAVQGRGKSGGVRVVYFFLNETLPIFLLAVFAKNEKANLSKAERNALAKLVVKLVDTYRG